MKMDKELYKQLFHEVEKDPIVIGEMLEIINTGLANYITRINQTRNGVAANSIYWFLTDRFIHKRKFTEDDFIRNIDAFFYLYPNGINYSILSKEETRVLKMFVKFYNESVKDNEKLSNWVFRIKGKEYTNWLVQLNKEFRI